ncbi:MAG: PQQ-binding-like beta-propeller repeat protein, partial [Armatimonadetes bacterium]|nr:PQQ-binding-like beta-propeller repeat protein [Armatimonadota bacterium]
GRIRGGVPNLNTGRLDGGWEIEGTMPALHIDSTGVSRLAVADLSDPDNYAVLVYERSSGQMREPLRIALEYPPYIGLTPYGRDFHLLVNLQTGVHTMALACYDAGGRLLWQDTHQGAHPRVPGAGDVNGDGQDEVIADDHGVLRIYDSSGSVIGTDNGWPPAYTLPIIGAFGKTGEALVLRASGIDAVSLIDTAAKERWKTPCERWRYYRSLGAVGDVSGDGRLALGTLAEGGMFDCIDAGSGKVRWSLKIGDPNETSVVSGDVDGNGKDEFLLGLSDGRLVCIAQQDDGGKILWEKRFEAGVANPIIADVDGDGAAEIIVGTSDGCVRILEE